MVVSDFLFFPFTSKIHKSFKFSILWVRREDLNNLNLIFILTDPLPFVGPLSIGISGTLYEV